jgi:hypothetical protein
MQDSIEPPPASKIKRLFILVAIWNCLIGFTTILGSFPTTYIYKKDFAQEYLMAKAIIHGVNPYLPVKELALIWLPDSNSDAITHPSLHPPLAGLLSLPLGFLSYRQAAIVWLIFGLACLGITWLLICRWFSRSIKTTNILLVLGITLGFGPVVDELWFGQLNACMLLLLAGSWMTLRKEKEVLGGALLGGVIALKWMAWPFILYLLLRRRWKSLGAAAMIVCAANLLALCVLGFTVLKDYYIKIVPSASYIRTFEFNMSASALGLHLFTELGWYHKLMPLWYSPTLATLSSLLITLTVLLIGLVMALRVSQFDVAFGILSGLSILVSPVAWSHYLLFSAIPIAVLIGQLRDRGFPRPFIVRLLWLLIPFLLTSGFYVLPFRFFSSQTTPDGLPIVPFAAGLVILLPTVSLCILLWLVWRLDSAKPLPRHLAF